MDTAINMQQVNLSIKLGTVVKAWRSQKGLTMQQVSKAGGISKSYISSIENDNVRNPRIETVQMIAQGLGIEYQYLQYRIMPGEELPEIGESWSPVYFKRRHRIGEHIEKLISTSSLPSTTKEMLAQMTADYVQQLIEVLLTERGSMEMETN